MIQYVHLARQDYKWSTSLSAFDLWYTFAVVALRQWMTYFALNHYWCYMNKREKVPRLWEMEAQIIWIFFDIRQVHICITHVPYKIYTTRLNILISQNVERKQTLLKPKSHSSDICCQLYPGQQPPPPPPPPPPGCVPRCGKLMLCCQL